MMTRAAVLAFFVVLLLLVFFFDARLAHAETFTVNSTGTARDEFPDGTCDSDPTAAVSCTLSEAIDEANDLRGADTIKFNIPTTETNCSATTNVCTIFSGEPMPQIEEPLSIDGYSQPGASPNTLAEGNDAVLKIELRSVTGVGAGLEIQAAKSTVKGLVINGWEEGVRIGGSGATGNKVMGNFIGTDRFGTQDVGNDFGVSIVEAPKNTVGGTTPAARNVISGNDQSGVSIGFVGATANEVMGNYIGTDKDGDDDLGNTVNGVFVFGGAANNTIGGTKATMRNVISGNEQHGVFISNGAQFNKVMGNYIGTDASGTLDLGNGVYGVLVDEGAANNTIGGTTAGARNIISGNDQSGVEILFSTSGEETTGNSILSNSIFSNDDPASSGPEPGIDLKGSSLGGGFTANDPGDADTGPNGLQNFPELSLATKTGKKTTIEGTLNSTASTTFTIQFFSSPEADQTNPCCLAEGQKLIGQISVTTDANGDVNGSDGFTATTPVVPAGQIVTATATNETTGDTSEFSVAVVAS